MGIIYPDNANRGNRVQQLAVNIGAIQSEVDDSLDRIDLADGHQTDTINKLFELYGFKGIDELKVKLDALLTPAQKAAYDAQVQHIRDVDAKTNTVLDASLLIAFISGTVGLVSRPIITVLDTGALAAGVNLFGRGFRAMLEGDVEGLRMMAAAYRSFRALATGVELGETAARVARIIRTAGVVLAVLGVVLDGVILIYQAIEGAEQKTELEKGINELVARRFMAKQLEQQIFATEAYVAQVSAFLITYTTLVSLNQPEAAIKSVMDALMANVVDNLHSDLSKITDTSTWAACADIDAKTGGAWKDDDPSLAWVETWIAAQPPLVSDDPPTPAPAPANLK